MRAHSHPAFPSLTIIFYFMLRITTTNKTCFDSAGVGWRKLHCLPMYPNLIQSQIHWLLSTWSFFSLSVQGFPPTEHDILASLSCGSSRSPPLCSKNSILWHVSGSLGINPMKWKMSGESKPLYLQILSTFHLALHSFHSIFPCAVHGCFNRANCMACPSSYSNLTQVTCLTTKTENVWFLLIWLHLLGCFLESLDQGCQT